MHAEHGRTNLHWRPHVTHKTFSRQNSNSVPTYHTRTITKKAYRTSVPYFLSKIKAHRTVHTYRIVLPSLPVTVEDCRTYWKRIFSNIPNQKDGKTSKAVTTMLKHSKNNHNSGIQNYCTWRRLYCVWFESIFLQPLTNKTFLGNFAGTIFCKYRFFQTNINQYFIYLVQLKLPLSNTSRKIRLSTDLHIAGIFSS